MPDEVVTTAIQFPKDLHERVKKAAEKDERSFAFVIRKAAEEYLEAHEEQSPTREPASTKKSK